MNFVLDACALIAYLRHELGGEEVEVLLAQDPPSCYVHAVNLCEVFYDFLRVSGEAVASASIARLRSVGTIICDDMDEAFWQQAGRYKVAYRLSLADAFAVSLAERLKGEIVTCDHREFEPVALKGPCAVRFFR